MNLKKFFLNILHLMECPVCHKIITREYMLTDPRRQRERIFSNDYKCCCGPQDQISFFCRKPDKDIIIMQINKYLKNGTKINLYWAASNFWQISIGSDQIFQGKGVLSPEEAYHKITKYSKLLVFS